MDYDGQKKAQITLSGLLKIAGITVVLMLILFVTFFKLNAFPLNELLALLTLTIVALGLLVIPIWLGLKIGNKMEPKIRVFISERPKVGGLISLINNFYFWLGLLYFGILLILGVVLINKGLIEKDNFMIAGAVSAGITGAIMIWALIALKRMSKK